MRSCIVTNRTAEKYSQLISLLLVFVLAGATLLVFSTGRAEGANRVGLVIQYLDGSVEKRCIEIGSAEAKGIDVLTLSGLEIQADYSSPLGAAICKIGPNGCSPQNCFSCDMPNYWSYWHLQKDTEGQWKWTYSQIGSSIYSVSPGQVEGWRYGAGQAPDEAPTFEEICAQSTPTPSKTATPTFTQSPTPTWTSTPTSTPEPIDTPEPTATTVVINPSGQDAFLPWGVQPTFTEVSDAPSETPTPIPSLSPATSTPSPSPTQTIAPSPTPTLATATNTPLPSPTATSEATTPPTLPSIPTETQVTPPTPTLWSTATSEGLRKTLSLPTKRASWANKSAQITPGIPVAQVNRNQPAMNTFWSESEEQPSSQIEEVHKKAAMDAPWKTIFLISGGMAGMLVFLVIFGVLGIGLVLALVRKRT